jgi:hypothetical protein
VPPTVFDVFRQLLANPSELLLRRWNWKSALFSSIIRALIFLFVNLTAGWRAAAGAMIAEFLFRAVTSGFYGSLTQAFRNVEPACMAATAVLILLPLVSHSLEFVLHYARGTPKLLPSLIASVIFTEISTLFNLYAMRRGALVVGTDAAPMGSDMRRIPALIGGFVISGPAALIKMIRKPQQF